MFKNKNKANHPEAQYRLNTDGALHTDDLLEIIAAVMVSAHVDGAVYDELPPGIQRYVERIK